ncbi:MAG: c-type cytochrome [Bacteroidia bacterium]
MKKNIEKSGNKMKFSHFIIMGIASLAVTLCFAFIPMKQDKKEKWSAPPESAKVKNPVASNDASIADGKKIFMKNCKSCHGLKGKGDGPKSEELDKSPGDFTKADFQSQTDGELFWKITNGKKPMPSYKKDLEDNERWQVINFLRTLKS